MRRSTSSLKFCKSSLKSTTRAPHITNNLKCLALSTFAEKEEVTSSVKSFSQKNIIVSEQVRKYHKNTEGGKSSENTENFVNLNSTSFRENRSNGIVAFASAMAALFGIYTCVQQLKGDDSAKTVLAEEKSLAVPSADTKYQTALDKDAPPIYKIVLTGGPCGGKSSSIILLRERLTAMGFQCFVVSEVVTSMITGGARFDAGNLNKMLAFESAHIKAQIAWEDCFLEIAKADKKPTILICDRGTLDPRAYLEAPTFEILLEQNGWTISKLRDRYNLVIHMVTAAIGAEQFYTRENNAARFESPEQAAELDMKIRNAYLGHPNFHIIDNSTNFEGKIQRVLTIVSRLVGAPKPVGIKRKILLAGPVKNAQIPVTFEQTEVNQVMLRRKDESDDEHRRLRKTQTADGSISYSLSSRIVSGDGKEEIVVFRPISARNYMLVKQEQQNQDYKETTKCVRSFVYEDSYFELVTYFTSSKSLSDPDNITCLCVEADLGKKVQVPEFLRQYTKQDVTLDPAFTSSGIAKRQ